MSIQLMSSVWERAPFKGTDLVVLLCLADHANDEGLCWPSYKRIAKRARTSQRWAKECVDRLSAAGWVAKEERGNIGKSNLYRVTIPPLPVEQGGYPATSGDDAERQAGVLPNRPPGVMCSSPESSGESSDKNLHEPSARLGGRAIEIPTYEVLLKYALSTDPDLDENLLWKPVHDLEAKIAKRGSSQDWRQEVDGLLKRIAADREQDGGF